MSGSDGLTWARLEDVSGFTRQALLNHPEIVERYGEAKAFNLPAVKTKMVNPKTADQRIIDLRREIDRLETLINRYDERWARYARNATLLGYDLERLEQPMDPPARVRVMVQKRGFWH